MKVLGIVGWSGSGKTTLITRLIPVLRARGVRVATLKHAHHAFDVDQPGKDSYEHRRAGAVEVIVSSSRRWAQMHEVGDGEPEATLAELLRRLSPCDLVLIEGFKTDRHPKLEVFRRANGKEPLHPGDERIVAIASDEPRGEVSDPLRPLAVVPRAGVPVVDLNDVERVADVVLERGEALEAVLKVLG